MVTERVYSLNDKALTKGKFILYWMQQSQRVVDNPALNFAITQANAMKLPLVVLFVVTPGFPDANSRHYNFMLQGLAEVFNALQKMKIETIITQGEMVKSVVNTAQQAVLLITDKGYLRVQRHWREQIAEAVNCSMIEVESDVLFPVEIVMQKEAYNAKVLRDKIYKLLAEHKSEKYLEWNSDPIYKTDKKDSEIIRKLLPSYSLNFNLSDNIKSMLPKVDSSVDSSKYYWGGYSEASKHLGYFIDKILKNYFEKRNDPGEDFQSQLSPYLHFGQISVREILAKVIDSLGLNTYEFWRLVKSAKPGVHNDKYVNGALTLFEEMIVRRELSMNFCHYNDDYDQYSVLPEWARTTLREHTADFRPYTYSLSDLENAQTHDDYWNTAQMEMVITGKMHGYMRMYWGKKIIEWSHDPEEAFAIAHYLNNKYELDGRDPNGYAGIAWCFGKHDRAWSSFPVFGKVRVMKDTGLKRKFDMQSYINRIKHL